MGYYVYILRSEVDGTYYKGSTEDPVSRLQDHNDGRSFYTSGKRPWQMVYLEQMPDKREMLIREKKLKRGNKEYFEELISGEKNIVSQFF
ncbi:MAG: GIY-YIG nuclease family protein [Chitinophagaceae bacterium]|nr:GIY-YIG nuclease family protein [Chitinophagaceae bacterium]